MDPATALSTLAQIATAVLGFTGLVTVFQARPVGDWSRVDKLRLFYLLGGSALPLALSLFGLVLLTSEISPRQASVAMSAASFLVLGWWVVSGIRRVLLIPKLELLEAKWSPALYWALQSLLAILILAQIYNALIIAVSWLPISLIAAQLGTSIVQFVRMIVSRAFRTD